MGKFRGKRKVGLKFGRHKKSTYKNICKATHVKGRMSTTNDTDPQSSPVQKRARVSSTPRKTLASPDSKCKSTSIRKRKLSFSITLLTSPFRKSPLSKRKTSTPARTTKRQLKFIPNLSLESDDLEPIIFESDDEISNTGTETIEPDTADNEARSVSDNIKNGSSSETLNHDTANIHYVTDDTIQQQFVLDNGDNTEEHDITGQILMFNELVKQKRFPLDNVALRLFLDTVNWFDQSDVRTMRYSPTALNFFWLGKKLFGGRFIRFMSGLKNETDFLTGKESLSPCNSSINFACPHENVLRTINPFGIDCNASSGPGLISEMIDLKARKGNTEVSYVLMFDGKKIRRGSDENLLEFEQSPTLKERQAAHDKEIQLLSGAMDKFKSISETVTNFANIQDCEKTEILEELKGCFGLVSLNLKRLRQFKKSKELSLNKLKEKASKDTQNSFAYAIDLCQTLIYQIDNCISTLLEVQWQICKSGAYINNAAHLFAQGHVVDLVSQENVKLLKGVTEMKNELNVDSLDPCLVKQRSPEWFEARKTVRVTGSTMYAALGCDTLKKQREHFDNVCSNIVKDDPTPVQQDAMRHGTESEIHEIATLASIVMPFMYPELVYQEEGYYIQNGIIVSPDGSLRQDKKSVFAFEGKAPMSNIYSTPVHYEVPERYIGQTVLEQQVLNATNGTLYLSWGEASTTVFIVPVNSSLCEDIQKLVNETYNVRVPKRPTRLSQLSKTLKASLKQFSDACIYVGEFPSVKGRLGEASSPPDRLEETICCILSELVRTLLKGIQAFKDSYNMQRKYASQVVVYLLADLNRLWKPEEPHAVPVLYYYRGYSLPMDMARKITDYCRKECIKKGIDVVATSSDGEFNPLIVHGDNGRPLTLFQLSKSVWTDVCKIQKSGIVNSMKKLNRQYEFEKGANGELTIKSVHGDSLRMITPVRGWKETKKRENDKNRDQQNDNVDGDIGVSEHDPTVRYQGCEEAIQRALDSSSSEEHVRDTVSSDMFRLTEDVDITILYHNDDINSNMGEDTRLSNENVDETLLYDFEAILNTETSNGTDHTSQDGSSCNFTITSEIASDMLHVLSLDNPEKWNKVNGETLFNSITKFCFLKSMRKSELLEICRYLNLKLIGTENEIKIKSATKIDLLNDLSKLFGLDKTLEKPSRKRRKTYSPKSLQDLASRALLKKTYPKQVLNIAYATYIWPEKVTEWRRESQICDKVDVVGVEDGYFEPYYLPEFDSELDTFKLFVYDKTHLATNFRKCVCLDRVDGVSVQAWKYVAKKRPDILHPSVVEVSDGKILDQMKEKLSRTMFSRDVESEMTAGGYQKEAHVCNVIREALFEADDNPGIPAKDRCVKRLSLIKWLADDVNFGSFPPYGTHIKGLSHVLYEGLRTSQESKLYLYAVAKGGSYCVRAPNTLCSESFFSSMQESDPWGQGILTSSGVEKHIMDFTTITAMKMEENRNIYIKTKRDTAYPTPEIYVNNDDDISGSDNVPKCQCRQNKYIRCIVPRDHFFDTETRAKKKKEEKPFKLEGANGVLKGEQPIRQQYGYKINATKMFTSKRLAIELNEKN